MTATAEPGLHDDVLQQVPAALDDLAELVRIPSVSSSDEHLDAVQRCAERVAALLRAEGVLADVVRAGGLPAVLGRKAGPPGAPTVLLYAHLDVQPTGPLEQWSVDPFDVTVRDGRLYGRGTSDDKAAVALHLALLRAFGDRLPVNLVVLVEGEEEIGSPSLPGLLEAHAEDLAADVVVVPDALNAESGAPTLTTALRGLAACTVELRTLERPVHSGVFGGVLPCALTTLVRLLGTLHTHDGDLAPGLMTTEDAPEVELDPARWLRPGVRETGTGSLAERVVGRGSITVLTIAPAGDLEPGNVLHAEARATLALRVPPSTDPAAAVAALTAHLRAHVPDGAQVQVTPTMLGDGFRASDGPALRAAESALSSAFGQDAVRVGVGGSIPFVAALAAHLPDAEFVVTALQDPASNAHGYDESLDLDAFKRACVGHARLLAALGEASGTSG